MIPIVQLLSKHRGKLIILLVVLAGIFVSHYSFLSINVEGASGEVNYTILNQGSNKSAIKKSKSTSYTRLVSRGSYEILASADNKSYFQVKKIGGFLKKTTITAKLSSEKAREYVGSNPESCIFYNSGVLYSYGCRSTVQVTTHQAGTPDQPSYNTVSDTPMGVFGGVIRTKEGLVVLAQEPIPEDGTIVPKKAFLVGDGLKVMDSVELGDLDSGADYSFAPYKDGFLAYDSVFAKMFYYSSLKAKPEVINIIQPKQLDRHPALINVRGETIALTFTDEGAVNIDTNKPGEEVARSVSNSSGGKVKTSVVIYQNGNSHELELKRRFSDIKLCGDNLLCALESDESRTLSIFDVSGKKGKLVYRVNGVSAVENSSSRILLVRDKEIIGFDTKSQVGSVDFSMGDFLYCGSTNDNTHLLLCLTNNKNKNVVLRVNRTDETTDLIDKKVEALQKIDEINEVSAYGKNIFVSANLGQADFFNSELNSFDYDPAVKATATAAIDKKVNELGFDTKTYTIARNF